VTAILIAGIRTTFRLQNIFGSIRLSGTGPLAFLCSFLAPWSVQGSTSTIFGALGATATLQAVIDKVKALDLRPSALSPQPATERNRAIDPS